MPYKETIPAFVDGSSSLRKVSKPVLLCVDLVYHYIGIGNRTPILSLKMMLLAYILFVVGRAGRRAAIRTHPVCVRQPCVRPCVSRS